MKLSSPSFIIFMKGAVIIQFNLTNARVFFKKEAKSLNFLPFWLFPPTNRTAITESRKTQTFLRQKLTASQNKMARLLLKVYM
jgi:hypothetical protein